MEKTSLAAVTAVRNPVVDDANPCILHSSGDSCTQRSPSDIALTIFLVLIIVVGVAGNLLTLICLYFARSLRELLRQTSVLVAALAASDLILCGAGVPLYTANLVLGYAAPFSVNPVVCHAVELLCWGWSDVSLWILFWIAFMRLTSTVSPMWHRSYLANQRTVWTMVGSSFAITFLPYVFGLLLKLYWVKPEYPGSGICYPQPYVDNDEFYTELFRMYQIIDAVTHCWIPLFAGLFCYVILYFHIRLRNSTKQARLAKFLLNNNASGKIQLDMGSLATAGSTLTNGTSSMTTTGGLKTKKFKQREGKIKMLLANFLSNILLTSPAMFTWGLGYTSEVAVYSPFLSKAMAVLYFASFPINPIVYAILSKDFRNVYASVLVRIFCCRRSSNNSVAPGGAARAEQYTLTKAAIQTTAN